MPFIDDFTTLRELAGSRKTEVAAQAKVSVDTINRVEKRKNSSRETLVKLVNALNELHYNGVKKPLNPSSLITEKSKVGEGRDKNENSQVIKFGKIDV